MTKQTEAMKLALEALEGAEALLLSMGLTHLIVYGDAEKAIAALREALALVNEVDQEQPAQDEPVAWISTGPARMIHWTSDIPAYGDDWIPLYTSPPAQRQCKFPLCHNEEYQQGLAEQIKRELYTGEPAQRTWVGLTDAEWMNIVNKDHAWFGQRPEDVAHEVAKLIEAKLKEKNT